jgi:hypothetical protein
MPLTLPDPPDLGPDFWEQPEIATAVQAGRLDLFLLAYRGARRARWPQDQVARWTGRDQGTISRIENGRVQPPPGQLYAILQSLHVPGQVTAKWGSDDRISRRGVATGGLS